MQLYFQIYNLIIQEHSFIDGSDLGKYIKRQAKFYSKVKNVFQNILKRFIEAKYDLLGQNNIFQIFKELFKKTIQDQAVYLNEYISNGFRYKEFNLAHQMQILSKYKNTYLTFNEQIIFHSLFVAQVKLQYPNGIYEWPKKSKIVIKYQNTVYQQVQTF